MGMTDLALTNSTSAVGNVLRVHNDTSSARGWAPRIGEDASNQIRRATEGHSAASEECAWEDGEVSHN